APVATTPACADGRTAAGAGGRSQDIRRKEKGMSHIPKTAAAPPRPERGLRATFVLALGTFAVGTDAYVVAGFLPAMAGSLDVSESTAGQSATVFALTYAVCSPVLATLAARVE